MSDQPKPNHLEHEFQAQKRGFRFIIGVDEAGRGPLAGPVVAAAVHLKTFDFENKICDSKLLSAPKRELALQEICEKAYVGCGIINSIIIDQRNILRATYLAMENAVNHLIEQIQRAKEPCNVENVLVMVDGPAFKTNLPYQYKTIINGDQLSFSISCASIVAKVTRDRMLKVYDKIFPRYGFAKHKGYGTVMHRQAIREFGLTRIHRKSFVVK